MERFIEYIGGPKAFLTGLSILLTIIFGGIAFLRWLFKSPAESVHPVSGGARSAPALDPGVTQKVDQSQIIAEIDARGAAVPTASAPTVIGIPAATSPVPNPAPSNPAPVHPAHAVAAPAAQTFKGQSRRWLDERIMSWIKGIAALNGFAVIIAFAGGWLLHSFIRSDDLSVSKSVPSGSSTATQVDDQCRDCKIADENAEVRSDGTVTNVLCVSDGKCADCRAQGCRVDAHGNLTGCQCVKQ